MESHRKAFFFSISSTQTYWRAKRRCSSWEKWVTVGEQTQTDKQMAHALQFSHSFKCARLCCIFQHSATYAEEQIPSGSGWTFTWFDGHCRELQVDDMSHTALPAHACVIYTTNLTILMKGFKNVSLLSKNTGNTQNTKVWTSYCMKLS